MTTRTESTSPAPERSRGLLHYLGLGLSFGLLAFVALIAGMVIVLPVATGSTAYTVMTGSMEPHYPPGTLVIVKPTDIDDIQIGDVVTYQIESGKPAVVTHRVVEVVHTSSGENRLVTQGDANDARDAGEVRDIQVRGTVWYAVPWIGWINNVLTGGTRAIVVPILAGVLFLYAGYMAASHLVGKRRAARREAAERLAEGSAEPTAAPVIEPVDAPLAPATALAAPSDRVERTVLVDSAGEPTDDLRVSATRADEASADEPDLVPAGLSRFAPRP